ncbi:DUF427 domain-containing protein [Actinacidiphila sp. ITFR-21]|uniref:DUF427 domain-containing protein n=1 Tax=Actinacidiphila sp. ITFR-21 TaxID=3075199 RepID=UPI00288B27F7|nr:DUF427 domain-containing protein [Streptomyces sp. ITFR-21]WNI16117.1 DUF427 domain-containing protein [Streptomyces sp. ITFR-21]
MSTAPGAGDAAGAAAGARTVAVERRHPPQEDALTWEPSERRVRGAKGGTTVVDSRRPVLVWEPGQAVPLYAFPREDVRAGLLHPAADPDTGAHTGSETFYDLVLDGETVANAAWTFPVPELSGYISFEWFRRAGRGLDHWYEEDEEIFVHPRDPYKRVDAIASTRHVRVEIDGVLVAETRRPVLVFETRLPVRYYIPPEDVRLDLFTPTDLSTGCPYKGTAEYWSLTAAGPDVPPDIAWSYPEPLPAVGSVRGLIAFYNEAVDITVDGEPQERPVTGFTAALKQPR